MIRKPSSLVTLVAALAIGCTSATIKEPLTIEDAALIKAIEKEIRKHDFWVEELIKQDYTGANNGVLTDTRVRDSKVRLEIIPAANVAEHKEAGFIGFYGSYNLEKDILSLPELSTEEERLQVIDALDHELLHVLFDKILFKEGYSGPSLEELTQYCQKKTYSSEFAKLREELRMRYEMQDLIFNRTLILNKYFKPLPKAIKTYNSTIQKMDDDNKLFEAYSDPEEKIRILAEQQKFQEKLKDYRAAVIRIANYLKELTEAIQSKNRIVANEDFEQIKSIFSKAEDELREYEGIGAQINDWRTRVITAYDAATDKYFEQTLTTLRQEMIESKDERIREEYRKQIENTEKRIRLLRDSRTFSNAIEAFYQLNSSLESIDYIFDIFVSVDNQVKISEVLDNPNEVMARMVDSLYSLYYGAVTQNKFPLSEEDLQFLERFNYKGEQLFRKGIEKNRLGLKLLEDGWTPERVKQELEYATVVRFEGRTYRWSENNFDIKGSIPFSAPQTKEDGEKER